MALDFIPEKFYIARQPRGNSDEWLGFMQPLHKEGFKQRKATADRWAGKNALEPIEWENKPTSGYSLTENKRRMMNKNVVWRVLHPLGFEFEITSDNFSDFLMEVDMKQGIIQTPMVFVRRRGENYLTYEGSPEHKKAQVQAIVETKVSLKDLNPGDHATLKNGERIKYLGAAHCLTIAPKDVHTRNHKDRNKKPEVSMEQKSWRYHFYHNIYDNNISTHISSSTTLNVISIDHKEENPTTNADLVARLREDTNKLTTSSGTTYVYDEKPLTLAKCKSTLTPLAVKANSNHPVLTVSGHEKYNVLFKLKGKEGLYSYSYCSYSRDKHRFTKMREVLLPNGDKMYSPDLEFGQHYWRSHWQITQSEHYDPALIEESYLQVIERV